MDKLFKALKDPSRRQILEMLKSGDLTAGEIASAFDMQKPSISHHLDLLRQADLVSSQKKGQYVYYSINTSVLDDLITWIMDLQQQPES
ncbi:MAG: autorepressor SdpR family transcription factor [Bacteroidota bacterium]